MTRPDPITPMRANQYACPDCDQPFGAHTLNRGTLELTCPENTRYRWNLPPWDGTKPDHKWQDSDGGRLERRSRWEDHWFRKDWWLEQQ